MSFAVVPDGIGLISVAVAWAAVPAAADSDGCRGNAAVASAVPVDDASDAVVAAVVAPAAAAIAFHNRPGCTFALIRTIPYRRDSASIRPLHDCADTIGEKKRNYFIHSQVALRVSRSHGVNVDFSAAFPCQAVSRDADGGRSCGGRSIRLGTHCSAAAAVAP